ncbi:MAG TPA: polysaccharide biosynthesis/export family protein [Terriglobales bacterium]|nr:polysaccharide biosynthesis/export family protein [Terriglobales bacterium]
MSYVCVSQRFRLIAVLLAVFVLSSVSIAQQPVAPITKPSEPVMEQQVTNAQPAATSTASANMSDLRIGPGDLLEISVFGAPESLKQVRVSSEGSVTYPFAGTLKLADMTVRQAEEALAKTLQDGGYYNNPTVSILVKEFATQGVSVLGEVQKPGIYPMMGPRQVLDAISAAGGLTPKAGRTVTVTHRSRPNQPQTVPLDDDSKNNIAVYPGDTVRVSKAGIVYVVGNVKQPGGFVMDNQDLSVLQAVALAQGVMPDSSLNSSKLIRKTPDGQQQEIPIKLKDVLSSKAPDVALKADDILFIPSNPAASAGKRGLQAALQVITGIAIYGGRR